MKSFRHWPWPHYTYVFLGIICGQLLCEWLQANHPAPRGGKAKAMGEYLEAERCSLIPQGEHIINWAGLDWLWRWQRLSPMSPSSSGFLGAESHCSETAWAFEWSLPVPLCIMSSGPLSYLLFTWADLVNRFMQLMGKWFCSVFSQVILTIYSIIAFEIISSSYNQNRFGQTEGMPNQPSQDASCGPSQPLVMWLRAGHWNASDIKLLICNVGLEILNGQSCYEKQMVVSLKTSYKSPDSGINMRNCVIRNSYIF